MAIAIVGHLVERSDKNTMTTSTPIPKLSSFTLPWPTNWTEIFGTERPLILEIGFGYGQYLEHLHKTRPDANIIGIEINNTCLVKAERAIPRKKMHNVRVVHSTAETALHHLFPPHSLSEIHINFPDPWFKERHAGRRLMQRDTLDAIVSRLQVGGMLYLATDIRAYADMSAGLLGATPGLTNTLDAPWIPEMPGRTITKYEKKAIAVDRPRHYFAYQRNQHPIPDVPLIMELPMPHIVFYSPLSLDELFTGITASDISDHTFEFGETRINFKNVYKGDQSLLFDIYAHEPTIDQRVSLALVMREDYPSEFTLKLGAIGNPRPTTGMHHAVRTLGERLLALHPETKVLQDKVKS